MGTWAAGSFDNDDASDWVWDLAEADSISVLQGALARVNDSGGYLEAPDWCMAIAAAEVVAALGQRPAPDLPDEVIAFVGRIAAPAPPTLVASALRAVERIETSSELQELWDESDSRDEWHQALAELRSRLG